MTDRELLRQALEALESGDWYIGQLEPFVYSADDTGTHEELAKVQAAIAALRERLAQPQMQPCAGRNCGSTNPNLHSAECFEDYEKSTGMNQWQGLTDEEINSVRHNRDWTAPWTDVTFARAIEAKLKEKNHG